MKVSIYKIIKSDFASLVYVFFPSVIFIFFIDSLTTGLITKIFAFLRGRSASSLLDPTGVTTNYIWGGMFAVSFLICGFLFLRRIIFFTKHFNEGVEVEGKIIGLNFERDRGTIEYLYIYNDKKILSYNVVHKSKMVKSLRVDQIVKLVIDKNKPNKAYLLDLYVK